MKRVLVLAALVSVLGLWPATASAMFNLSGSVGTGMTFVHGDVQRARTSLEVIPALSFSILKIDLGLYWTVEKPIDFSLRPGVRVSIPFIGLYGRAAIPLQLTHTFDYGFLLGLGSNVLSLGILSIFIEADTYFTKNGNWSDVVPLEFRAGVSVGF
jgi:hypothetical protein